MPDVTILMAVYNGMPELPDAVESIRGQTLRDWKCVIVDDGSTDATAEYLARLDDPRIEVLRGPKQGLGASLNLGLQSCHTQFVARMDGDDVAHPTRLEEQLAFLRAHAEVGLLGTQIVRMGEVRTASRSLLPCDHDAIVAHLMAGMPAVYHPTILCRTALLKEIGGYWTNVSEDWDMLLRMAERTKLANLDRILLSYRLRSNSLTGFTMVETRTRIAFACELARRRQSGAPAVGYDEFLAMRRAAPWWRRALAAVEMYARCQYRLATVEMLGRRRLRGYLRLGWAALCAPWLTQTRIARTVRYWRAPATRGLTDH
jgi:glycosyltransferase involved in cell wall biosynthesis